VTDPTSTPEFHLGARIGALLGVAGMTGAGLLAELFGHPWWLPAPVALLILLGRAVRAAGQVPEEDRG
jgi:hypothetical protein